MYSKAKLLVAIAATLGIAAPADAQTEIFRSDTIDNCYRIPALVKAKDGTVTAFSDFRPCRTDVGGGQIDVVVRQSHDNGVTWGSPTTILKGNPNGPVFDIAHGDAAVVTDRTTGRMLMMCASGNVFYWHSTLDNPNRVGRYYSTDGIHWQGEEITDEIYSLMGGAVHKLFFTSGRVCQSAKIKAGKNYRIYSALCTNIGNVVLFSDDFGCSWQPLGGKDARPTLDGDEAKLIELPDGNVLLSSRSQKGIGRIFNIFTYDNAKKATGSWADPVYLDAEYTSARCNGEILLVPARRKSDGKKTNVLLYSVPQSKARENVGIYYKELASKADYSSPSCFTTGWESYRVTTKPSAYSTLLQTDDRDILIFYEETESKGGYDMMLHKLSLSTITGGKYEAR